MPKGALSPIVSSAPSQFRRNLHCSWRHQLAILPQKNWDNFVCSPTKKTLTFFATRVPSHFTATMNLSRENNERSISKHLMPTRTYVLVLEECIDQSPGRPHLATRLYKWGRLDRQVGTFLRHNLLDPSKQGNGMVFWFTTSIAFKLSLFSFFAFFSDPVQRLYSTSGLWRTY